MKTLLILAEAGKDAPQRFLAGDLVNLGIVGLMMLLVPLATRATRAIWLAGLKKMPVDQKQVRRRIDTVISFVGSIVYFGLALVAVFFAIKVVVPDFDPLAATGALSIIALILTGMFKDAVVDVVKGLDILLGGHYDVGDYVEVAGTSGHVVDFQLKYTRLRRPSGEVVVLANSKCIPSRRYRQGCVTSHVSVPLAAADDQAEARRILDRVATELNDTVEEVQGRPNFEASIALPATGGVILRYALKILPGCEWVVGERFVPLLRKSLEQAEIALEGEPSYFLMNEPDTFRLLFQKPHSPEEVERIIEQNERDD